MSWQNLIYLIPYAVALAISSSVGIYAWRRRAVRGAAAFAVLALAMALRTLGHVLELISPGLEAKIFWDNVHILGEVIMLIAAMAFVLDYTEHKLSHPKRTLVLLSIVPVLFLLLFFTNSLHGLLRPTILFFPGEPLEVLSFDITPPVIVFALYAYVLFLSGLILLFTKFMRSKPLYRAQVATIIGGLLMPAIGMALPVMGINLGENRDISHFAFAIGTLIIAWGLFHYRLFDIVPVARDLVIESMSDPVIVVDAQNRVVDLNPAAQANLNRPVTEVIGQPVGQVYSDWPDLVARYRGVEEETHAEIVVSDGEDQRYFDLRLSPLRDRRGHLTGRVLVVRDITPGRQAEEALRESEEKYRRLVESTTDWVWSVDAEGCHTFSNKAVKHLLGYEVDEVVGSLAFSLMHPEDRAPMQEMVQKSVERKTGWTDVAVRWLHKDGSVRFFESTAQPLLDAEGHLIGFTGIDRDITERKLAEEELKKHREQLEKLVEERTAELTTSNEQLRREIADRKQAEGMLRESEERYQSLFESSPEAIFLIGPDGRIADCNNATEALIGRSREELIGKLFTELGTLPEDDLPQYAAILERILSGEEIQPLEVRVVTEGKALRLLEVRPVVLREDDKVWAIQVLGHDITERKQAEEALKESELRFRSLIEQTTDAVFCYEFDPPIPTDLPVEEQVKLMYDCTLVECNDVCAKSYGDYRPEDVVGRKLVGLFGTVPGSLDKLFTAMVESGYQIIDEEGIEKLPDGTERYFLNNGHGVVVDGKLLRVWGTFRDITDRRRAEEAVRASEEKHRSLFEYANDSIFIIDPATQRILDVNENAARRLGYTREELLQMELKDLDTPEDAAGNEAIIRELEKTGSVVFERTHLRKDGTSMPVEISSRVIEYGDQRVIQSFVRDITERKQAEEALSQRQRELESLLETSADLLGILDLDALLSLIAQRATSLLDADECAIFLLEADGSTLRPILVVGEHADEMMAGSLQVGQGLTGYAVAHNRPILVNDSHTDPRSSYALRPRPGVREHLMVTPLSYHGRITGAMGVTRLAKPSFVDENLKLLVGLARQAAIAIENARLYQELEAYSVSLEQAVRERTAELQKEKEQAEAILKGAADAILITDAEGTVVSINPALETQTGFRADDIIGQQFRLLADPAEGQRNYQAVADAARVGSQWRGEMVLKRKDNTTFDADLGMAPLRESEGSEPWGFVFTIRDISARKEVDRLKDEFVSNVSHELRSPITSLKLRQHLIETRAAPEKLEHHLSVIRRETVRLERTIDDLLYLSRLDQRQIEPDLTLVDINTLAEQYVTDRALLAEEKGLTLTLVSEPDLPPVRADEGLLGQVMSILLTNAIEYTPAGGQVIVSTRPCRIDRKRWVGFDVSDTGPGIPLAEQPRLFERFFRGKVGQASGVSGTGLGLAIAREIVERHEGQLEVESEGIPGKGARFTVWLPVDEQVAG